MIKVKLTFPFLEWPIERQTSKHSGVWENCDFLINKPVKKCDYWVVFDGLVKKDKTICPKGNTILITAEPPTIREYDQQFINQFDTVITCHKSIKHKNPVYNQQGLPWHVGRRQKNHINMSFSKDYDELMSIYNFHKDKQISVISSTKDFSIGHRKRIEFVDILKQHFGDQIDVFGRGYREIEDKWDGLARYKYHIALENSSIENYWTEKLGDAYLAGCYPIYYGCPNIEKYFKPSALTIIDITYPEKAIQIIESCLKASKYEYTKQEIKKAKQDVLNRYNLFAMICEYINTNQPALNKADYVKIKIRKEPSKSNIFNRIRSFVGRIRS
ncbi:glycosyltransferase family 10 domain-containing protein [Thermodesulfobacteriota bacterium]